MFRVVAYCRRIYRVWRYESVGLPLFNVTNSAGLPASFTGIPQFLLTTDGLPVSTALISLHRGNSISENLYTQINKMSHCFDGAMSFSIMSQPAGLCSEAKSLF